MGDVANVHNENENLKKVRIRLLQWEAKTNPLAALSIEQEEHLEVLTNAWQDDTEHVKDDPIKIDNLSTCNTAELNVMDNINYPKKNIDTTYDFLMWYDDVREEMHKHVDERYHCYLNQLELRNDECSRILNKIDLTVGRLRTLSAEYEFVSQKTSALNTVSEKLIEEQHKLQEFNNEIQRRLHHFHQVDLLMQRLQSPTLSVSSEAFKECLNRIDECLLYLQNNYKFKESSSYIMKYKHCLAKAITLIKNYVGNVLAQATEATLNPKQNNILNVTNDAINPTISTPDATFALYYGKYQTSAVKIKRITQMIEPRIGSFVEYEQLLTELQQNYLHQRASIMSPAVDQAIKDIRSSHKGDHCSLMRSSCAFLVHICQDEQRLYYQFFGLASEQLTLYLEGLCNILYDTMRPYIIHINHLETLAEICSILRTEMLEEHVQQNPDALEAFSTIANQLLQDVQERLVFRAHLYLNSDILNYNPSTGDLAYPEKLEMMESIALSLQEPHTLKRSDSRASLHSTVSSAIESESTEIAYRTRNINSPADLHGMWYPTVRRTLVCLSRLYRCVDRPIFQGLSQEALKLCIQSVSAAAIKIAAAKTQIDGELFEIKHLLILREQIAPFRVDFTVKETSLDFSKVKTAAIGLLHKRKQLFSMGSNNALLEFLLDGTPQIKEHLLDSRKEVDRQLKMVCEQFIKDAAQTLVGPITNLLEKAQALLANNSGAKSATNPQQNKMNYILRQTQWASPQVISSVIQETQRMIKAKLPTLQRSMQLYLSNRETEFIIFRPIRNNVIQTFVKLEQILTTNGYTSDDMIIVSCPSAEQVSIMLSSASILAAEGAANFSTNTRKISSSSNEASTTGLSTPVSNAKKFNFDKKVMQNVGSDKIENLEEIPESSENSVPSPTPPQPE